MTDELRVGKFGKRRRHFSGRRWNDRGRRDGDEWRGGKLESENGCNHISAQVAHRGKDVMLSCPRLIQTSCDLYLWRVRFYQGSKMRDW